MFSWIFSGNFFFFGLIIMKFDLFVFRLNSFATKQPEIQFKFSIYTFFWYVDIFIRIEDASIICKKMTIHDFLCFWDIIYIQQE